MGLEYAPLTARRRELPPQARQVARDIRRARGRADEAVAIAARFPQAAREWLEGELLPQLAAAELAGNTIVAANRLAVASRVGTELRRSNGDHMAEDAVAEFRSAARAPGRSAQRAALLDGYRLYGAALASYRRGEFAAAGRLFAQSRTALDRSGSRFAAWAAFHVAVCAYQDADYDSALATLAVLKGALWIRNSAFGSVSFAGRSRAYQSRPICPMALFEP